VHVYDIDSVTANLNWAVLRSSGIGVFHAGVEVLGDEWFFRFGPNNDSGVMWMEPRSHQVHIYSESVCVGESELSEEDIREVIADLMERWPSNLYHPITRNCVDFAEEFVKALRCPEPFPAYVRGVLDVAKSPVVLPVADYAWDWVKWWNSPYDQGTAC
ncbi:unnamed protein product, partial [Polarella glacialis]